MDIDNLRAAKARKTVLEHSDDDCLQDAVVDLLTDMLHLCSEEKLDFVWLSRIAQGHCEFERENEGAAQS
ncbi:MAG: hypothetical protein NXI32_05105 [bacterium]|nr:hypothetical protein [bacterium]